MPRRRTLSPEFFSDEDLATLPFEARLLYAGLWCYADRDGRLEDRPKYLKAMLFPYDRVDVEKLLCQLANPQIPYRPEKVFVRRYCVDGRQLIDIPKFSTHQNPHPHEPMSQYPDMSLHVTASSDIVKPKNDTSTLHTTNDQGPVKGPKTKDQKTSHGEFQNVKLTNHEIEKLELKFGKIDMQRRIENLSQYIASKGKQYKDHYATLLQWAARDKQVTPHSLSNGTSHAPNEPNWGKTVTAKEVWFCGCYRNDHTPCKSPDHGKTYEEVMAQ